MQNDADARTSIGSYLAILGAFLMLAGTVLRVNFSIGFFPAAVSSFFRIVRNACCYRADRFGLDGIRRILIAAFPTMITMKHPIARKR